MGSLNLYELNRSPVACASVNLTPKRKDAKKNFESLRQTRCLTGTRHASTERQSQIARLTQRQMPQRGGTPARHWLRNAVAWEPPHASVLVFA